MKIYFHKYLKNEMGASLAEILVSIVILSILLFFFLGMFINSSKVNVKSEEVIDATYVAQTEIENLYAISKQTKLADRVTKIAALGYGHVSGEPGDFNDPVNPNPTGPFLIFKKDMTDYSILLKIKNDIIINPTEPLVPIVPPDPVYNAMTSAIIEVDSKTAVVGNKASAKMELLLQWERDSTP